MIGKILDMNITDAFISFQDGTTVDIGVAHLPPGSKVGDTINIDPMSTRMTNDKLIDFF
jgi:hypothetical protein